MDKNKKFISLGLMSGTSADGVDLGLIETDGHKSIRLLENESFPYDKNFRQCILKAYGSFPSSRTESLEKEITLFHILAVQNFIKKHKISSLDLLGFHGQTINHIPPVYDREGFCIKKGRSYQIGNGHLLSKELNRPIVFNFRSQDMFHGGQGAPLVPIFHWALATQNSVNISFPIAWINIGGVTNITFISSKNSCPDTLEAFDMGPGNALIDDWVYFKTQGKENFDKDGCFSKKGKEDILLINKWLQNSYFRQPPPKSMDRNLFESSLKDCQKKDLTLEDGAATLTAFTVKCIEKQINFLPQKPATLLISGGGAKNISLVTKLKSIGPSVQKTDDWGWNSDSIEAYAFAYLAVRKYLDLPLTFPKTTRVEKAVTGGVLCKP